MDEAGGGSTEAASALVSAGPVASAGDVVMAASPEAAVAALSAAVDAVLGAPWWRAGDAEVAACVVDVERAVSRLDAGRLRLLTEADQRAVGQRTGALSTAEWLAEETNTRRGGASARVGLARALNGDLAVTGAALAAAALSVDHAGVVHRVMGALPSAVDAQTRGRAEEFLVEQAGVLDPDQLARVGRVLRARLAEDAGERADVEEGKAIESEALTLVVDDDGRWHLHGVLAPESGARLAAALDPLTAPAPAREGVRDRSPARQRRAQALVHLADTWLSGASEAGCPTVGEPTSVTVPGSARAHLSVTIALSDVLAPRAPGASPAILEGGHPISPATLAALACDGLVTPVLVDAERRPLDVGRSVYAFPARIRHAITMRDKGCTYPGCHRPPGWTQVHHLQSYASGGATSEANGALLCGYHHRIVHARVWRGHVAGTAVVWDPPERGNPHSPPPPWAPSMDRLIDRWREQYAERAA